MTDSYNAAHAFDPTMWIIMAGLGLALLFVGLAFYYGNRNHENNQTRFRSVVPLRSGRGRNAGRNKQ